MRLEMITYVCPGSIFGKISLKIDRRYIWKEITDFVCHMDGFETCMLRFLMTQQKICSHSISTDDQFH